MAPGELSRMLRSEDSMAKQLKTAAPPLIMVRRRGSRRCPPPTIAGIDDWAWRRNHRYDTLVCDLERHATIALLPDRKPATAEVWLSQQSQICVVARDRGGGGAAGASARDPGCRPLAFDGERERRLSRCCSEVHAPDPDSHRNCDG
jgi:hypothetical protein